MKEVQNNQLEQLKAFLPDNEKAKGNYIIRDLISELLDLAKELKGDLKDKRVDWFELIQKYDNAARLVKLGARYSDFPTDAVALLESESYQKEIEDKLLTMSSLLDAQADRVAVDNLIKGVYLIVLGMSQILDK